MSRPTTFLVTVLLGLLAFGTPACSGPVTPTEADEAPDPGAPEFDIWKGDDPCPTCAGIFVGENITFSNCNQGSAGPGGDADHDNFGGLCERQLAIAFAPELRYNPFDQTMGREPYWAVRPHGSNFAVIFYALSYYEDGGTDCSFAGCSGHPGDSEYIVLQVWHDVEVNHWNLSAAWYSRHGGENVYVSSALEFPSGVAGSYPRSYVALNKHANYATRAECNAGGFGGLDNCQANNQQARVEVVWNRNIGSDMYRLRDCVESERVYQGNEEVECYWTETAWFRGWTGVNPTGNGADPYRDWLSQHGVTGIQ